MSDKFLPDTWCILRSKSRQYGNVDKILSSWNGDSTMSGEWRLSSRINRIEDKEDHYLVKTGSGSMYELYKHREGISGLMYTQIEYFHALAATHNEKNPYDPPVSFEVISMDSKNKGL